MPPSDTRSPTWACRKLPFHHTGDNMPQQPLGKLVRTLARVLELDSLSALAEFIVSKSVCCVVLGANVNGTWHHGRGLESLGTFKKMKARGDSVFALAATGIVKGGQCSTHTVEWAGGDPPGLSDFWGAVVAADQEAEALTNQLYEDEE